MRCSPHMLKINGNITKENITEMIKNNEKTNNKDPPNWGKYEHRNFNTNVWNKTREMLDMVQKENFAIGENNNDYKNTDTYKINGGIKKENTY